MLNPSGTINVLEGSNGTLTCMRNAGDPTSLDAVWTFGSTQLAESQDIVSYSYTNIMRTQSGEYNCTLTHDIGSLSFSVTRVGTVTINVQCKINFQFL